jgi:predicted nuclease of predicted toxin-antitoxin system
MKIKLDENIPTRLVEDLAALGHDVDTAPGEGLAGRPDDHVWRAAQSAERYLVTQDLDFSDTRLFVPGGHWGVLLVRLRRPGRSVLRERILELFRNEPVESWSRCFVVATDSKVRIRAARLSGN